MKRPKLRRSFFGPEIFWSGSAHIINALRGHLAEFGLVVAKGPAHVGRLIAQAEDYTRGKQRLGKTSKMGERTLRRLLIIGASAVVRWAARNGAPAGSWLERMLVRKPRMLVAVALANKMARIIWALLAKGGIYRASIAAA